MDAEKPWYFENAKPLDLKAGFPEHYEDDDVRESIADGTTRPATDEEIALVRSFDPNNITTAEGFEVGDLYVVVDEIEEPDAEGFDLGASRFGYRPDYRTDRPWVLQNPDFFTQIFRGPGPHSFLHDGDINDRIERGELRKVTEAELVKVKAQVEAEDLLF